jgi:hypothetical protein
MLTVATVARRVQILMQEFGQDSNYNDIDQIIRYLTVVKDDIAAELEGIDLNFDTQVVVLSNVPAETTDLSTYQDSGGPLEQLIVPSSTDGSAPVEWRLAGQSDLTWKPVPELGKVEDTNSGTGALVVSIRTGVSSYEFRGGIVYISPSNQAVDLRIRGQFMPDFADNDAAQYTPGLTNVLAYPVCALISALRGGSGTTAAVVFKDLGKAALFTFQCRLTKAGHSQDIRLGGRRTQLGGTGQGLTVPIVDNAP